MLKIISLCLLYIYCANAKGQEIYDFQDTAPHHLIEYPDGVVLYGFIIHDDTPDFVYRKYKGIKKIEEQRWRFNPDTNQIKNISSELNLNNNKSVSDRKAIGKIITFAPNALPIQTKIVQSLDSTFLKNICNWSEELVSVSADSSTLIYNILLSTQRLLDKPFYMGYTDVPWTKRVDRDAAKRTIRIRWLLGNPIKGLSLFSDDFLLKSLKYPNFYTYMPHYNDNNFWWGPRANNLSQYTYLLPRSWYAADELEHIQSRYKILPDFIKSLTPILRRAPQFKGNVELKYTYTDTSTVEYCYIVVGRSYYFKNKLCRVRHFDAKGNETQRIIFPDDSKDTIYYHYNSAGDLSKIDMRHAKMPINIVCQYYQKYPSYLYELFVRQEPINWYSKAAQPEAKSQEFIYLSFDERGNWTARLVRNSLFPYQIRRLEYYD
jgi:(2Fe-2S) ferredoxin